MFLMMSFEFDMIIYIHVVQMIALIIMFGSMNRRKEQRARSIVKYVSFKYLVVIHCIH